MVFDAFVAAGAVASPSSSLAAGSDLGATSALSSSCADGRSRRRVTVIPESNAPSVPPLAWVLAIERYPHRAGGCGGAVVLCRPKRSACGCLRGSCPGDFPDNFYLEVLDRQHRRGRSLRASQGAWPPPGSNSMTLLLPCTHMLTCAALSHPHRSLVSRHLQNYGRGSTTSRRAHAAAIISAPPRTARTAASCTRSQAPSPGSSRCVVGCWRATWGGQSPVGPCSLVPPGTAEPSRLDRR